MTCEQCEHFREWLSHAPDDWRGWCPLMGLDRDGDEPACRRFEERDEDGDWI